jgi:hypothetical protein
VCRTAAEFLDNLRISHPNWRGQNSDKWAFRGQGDARWHLVPKAFRPDTDLGYKGKPVHPPLPPLRQFEMELAALNHFLFTADRVGLPIPGDNQSLRLPSTIVGKRDYRTWPWPAMLEVLAIAQHHGVPTRLVDFSHNSLVAAFFAAESAAKKLTAGNEVPRDTCIAVWAVDLWYVADGVEAHRARNEKPTVIWVTASRAANTYLQQQDALFLLDLLANKRKQQPPQLETGLLDVARLARLPKPADPPVVRILLSADKAMDVLRLLWNEFYHPARLMPDYDNVAALAQYRRWLGM